MTSGTVRIKNVSGEDYAVAELGGLVVAPQAEIDLLDDTLPVFYDDWEVARRLVTEPNEAQLYQDILLGEIEVVELREPVGM